METVEVADLYQASYLLINGCKLEQVTCEPVGTHGVTCKLSFSGTNLQPLVMNWFEKKAVVNLSAFRSGYNQICNSVSQAKKDYTASLKASLLTGGAQ